jgi:hypothetical protein
MSIYGIGSSGVNRPANFPVRDNGGTQRTPAQIPAKLQPPAPQTKSAIAAPGLPAEPPPGTDPNLWSILSGEERAFFAKAGAMGPLTYGRAFTEMKSAQMPANRGGRLDVKI